MTSNVQTNVQKAINLFSRVLAILALSVLPIVAGISLDRAYEFSFMTTVGAIVGILFGCVGIWTLMVRVLRESQTEVDRYRQHRLEDADDRTGDVVGFDLDEIRMNAQKSEDELD